MLNYAVDRLTALPNTSVYLDGTHSGWLNVGDITDRLLKAGVREADGFFLNASNYQWTQNLEQYGTWISSCIAYVTQVSPGDFGSCGNQYWSGGPANNWTGVALDPAKIWSDTCDRSDGEHRGHQLPLRPGPRRRPADQDLHHRHQPQRAGTVDTDR